MNLHSRLAGLALVGCFASSGWAVPVTPGGPSVALPGSTVAAHPEYAGLVLQDVLTPWVSAIDPAYGFPGASGTLQSRVVRETSTGALDFYWQVNVSNVSYPAFVPLALILSGLSLGDYLTGSSFDADYRIDSGGFSAPTGAFSTDAGKLTYEFSGMTLGPGTSTLLLLLHSNATDYDSSAFATLGVSTVSTFAPVAAVPEPGTWALIAGGIAALALLRRRLRDA